jgi:hypothetical protein
LSAVGISHHACHKWSARSVSVSLRLHRLDNQCRPVPGFLTDPGPVRATGPLWQTGLGSARLSGTRRETLNRLWVLTAGQSVPAHQLAVLSIGWAAFFIRLLTLC